MRSARHYKEMLMGLECPEFRKEESEDGEGKEEGRGQELSIQYSMSQKARVPFWSQTELILQHV